MFDNATAKRGSTTASIADAMIGSSKVRSPSVNVGSTSSGFVVTAPGTIATSSKPQTVLERLSRNG